MSDYNKSIDGSTTYQDDNPIHCDNASLSATGSSTMILQDITCTKDLTTNISGSSTLKINGDAQVGGDAKLSCGDSGIFGSTTIISSLKCKNGRITLGGVDKMKSLKPKVSRG